MIRVGRTLGYILREAGRSLLWMKPRTMPGLSGIAAAFPMQPWRMRKMNGCRHGRAGTGTSAHIGAFETFRDILRKTGNEDIRDRYDGG